MGLIRLAPLALAVSACALAPVATPSSQDGNSPDSVATPLATPAQSPTSLEASPTATRAPSQAPSPVSAESTSTPSSSNGIRVEISLDQSSATIGDRIEATVHVTNEGSDAPYWETNTCYNGPAPLEALVVDALPAGRSWGGKAAVFKEQVLRRAGIEDGLANVGHFVLSDAIDRQTPLACALYSALAPFEPGQIEKAKVAWDVHAPPGVLIPPGTMILRATFTTYASGRHDEQASVTAEATIDIDGEDGQTPTLIDYIDAALSEPSFRDFVESQTADPTEWCNAGVNFWPKNHMPRFKPYTGATSGAVDVSLCTEQDFVSVVLERSTAEVLGTRFGSQEYADQPTPTPPQM